MRYHTFEECQSFVKKQEGGYQKIKNDSGNYTKIYSKGVLVGTNYGISAPTLELYLKRAITEKDMKALSYETALKIYRKYYWDAVPVENAETYLRLQIYDIAVNQGVSRAKYALRFKTNKEIYNYRIEKYNDVIQLDKSKGEFRNVWLSRAKRAYEASENVFNNFTSDVKYDKKEPTTVSPPNIPNKGGGCIVAIINFINLFQMLQL